MLDKRYVVDVPDGSIIKSDRGMFSNQFKTSSDPKA